MSRCRRKLRIKEPRAVFSRCLLAFHEIAYDCCCQVDSFFMGQRFVVRADEKLTKLTKVGTRGQSLLSTLESQFET
jgi:hypothetical protein